MLVEKAAPDAIHVEGVGRNQVVLLLVGAFVLFCDGFDAQIMGTTAPGITADWHLARGALASVFAANLAGLMVGAITITPLADLYSRKRIIVASVAAFGLLSLALPFAATLAQMGVLRFLTGLALGAAMPIVIAVASEYVPVAVRARLVVALCCAFSAGFAICGVAASLMVGPLGWRSMFWLGGLMPVLVAVPLVLVWLPESPTYLVARGRVAELTRLLASIGPGLRYEPALAPVLARPGFPVSALFREGRAPITLLIWLTYFCSGATLYFLTNWLPLLMSAAGFGADTSALSATAYQIGGLVGGFLIGWLVDRHGPIALSLWMFAACFGVALIGPASATLPTILAATLIAGVLVVGAQNTLNAFTGGKLYPSHIRATGLGWALGMVRLGGVLAGSLAAGFVVGLDLGPRHTFLIIGAPELVCGVALLGIHLRQHRAGATVAAE